MIAAAGEDGEAAQAVGVELADGLTNDVEFIGFYVRKLTDDFGECFRVGRFGLGGARTLSGLSHVSFKGLDRDRKLFLRVCISDSCPGGKVTIFDGCQPGKTHRKPCTRVQVANQGSHAG